VQLWYLVIIVCLAIKFVVVYKIYYFLQSVVTKYRDGVKIPVSVRQITFCHKCTIVRSDKKELPQLWPPGKCLGCKHRRALHFYIRRTFPFSCNLRNAHPLLLTKDLLTASGGHISQYTCTFPVTGCALDCVRDRLRP
jgi:hypothetical protein